MFELIALN